MKHTRAFLLALLLAPLAATQAADTMSFLVFLLPRSMPARAGNAG